MTFKQPGFSLHAGTSPAKAASPMKRETAHAGVSPAKQKPGSMASQDAAHDKYLREMKTYGKRPDASPETKDYYEGQTKKTSTKGKIKAFVKSATGGGSYKEEKKKQRKKAYTKGKKPPSDYETLKYMKKQPRTSTTPQR